MNTIPTIIDTLYEQIIRISVGFLSAVQETFSLKPPPQKTSSFEQTLAETGENEKVHSNDQTTFKTVNEVLRTKTQHESVTNVAAPKNMVMYTSSVEVPVYANPTIEFDTKIGTIPYGEMVMMIDIKGRFNKIVWNNVSGWVLKDDLVDRAAHIYPELIIGKENLSQDPNTLHIRAMLGDIFGVGRADFPLQAGEYVLYKLWEKNIHVAWPETRPRTPGLWHTILRGVQNIHVGVMPTVGSIMEYVQDDDFGHLAYVDAVFPDNTISISEANYPDSGKYNERILTKAEWKELRPVFIQTH